MTLAVTQTAWDGGSTECLLGKADPSPGRYKCEGSEMSDTYNVRTGCQGQKAIMPGECPRFRARILLVSHPSKKTGNTTSTVRQARELEASSVARLQSCVGHRRKRHRIPPFPGGSSSPRGASKAGRNGVPATEECDSKTRKGWRSLVWDGTTPYRHFFPCDAVSAHWSTGSQLQPARGGDENAEALI